MKTHVLVATLLGGVFGFLMGWLVYGIALMDFYTANSIAYEGLMKAEPSMVAIFLSCVCWAWLFALVFDKWAGIRDFKSGLMAGMMITLPIVLSMDIYFYGTMNLWSDKLLVVDIIVGVVFNGIVAGVVGLLLGKLNKSQG